MNPLTTLRYSFWSVLGLCLLWTSTAIAKPEGPQNFDQLRLQTEQHILAFRFDEAEGLIKQMHLSGYQGFYRNHILLYKFMGSQNGAYLSELRKQWNTHEDALEDLPDRDPLKLAMLAEMRAFRALAEFMDRSYITAVRYAQSSRRTLRDHGRSFPQHYGRLKLEGLFNVALSAVPSNYQWLARTLGFKGNLNQGFRQLKLAAKQGNIFPMEAEIILHQAEKAMLNDAGAALKRMQKIQATMPNNMLIDYLTATALLRVKRNDQAIQILRKRNTYARDRRIFFLPFWDYSMGKAYYFRNEFDQARTYLASFIKGYKGSLMRTDAYFRLGMALTLDGRYDLGKPFFQVIATEEHGGFDEDEYAEFMAKKFATQAPEAAAISLFQARNAFDGGYYKNALAALNKLKPSLKSGSPWLIEWHYRFGRVQHTQGHLMTAREHYLAAMARTPRSEDRWLQAYASFFCGEIAREQGKRTEAISRYRQALSYDDFFYQNSLENRCKAALEQLGG